MQRYTTSVPSLLCSTVNTNVDWVHSKVSSSAQALRSQSRETQGEDVQEFMNWFLVFFRYQTCYTQSSYGPHSLHRTIPSSTMLSLNTLKKWNSPEHEQPGACLMRLIWSHLLYHIICFQGHNGGRQVQAWMSQQFTAGPYMSICGDGSRHLPLLPEHLSCFIWDCNQEPFASQPGSQRLRPPILELNQFNSSDLLVLRSP